MPATACGAPPRRSTRPTGSTPSRWRCTATGRGSATGWSSPNPPPRSQARRRDGEALPVLVDTGADSWALTIPDPQTIAALPGLLPPMADPMLRATTWNSLRNAFHNAELDPRDALAVVLASLPLEDPGDGAGRTMGWVRRQVVPLQPDPVAARAAVHTSAQAHLAAADVGSERQLAAFRAVVATSADAATLAAWADEHDVPEGLDVDVDLRWRVLSRLAELGPPIPTTSTGRWRASRRWTPRSRTHGRAASLPTDEAKSWAWQRFTGRAPAANHEVGAAGIGFWQPGQEAVTGTYVERYFDDLPATRRVRSGWLLAEVAASFFPWTCLEQATVDRARALVDDTTLDVSLRRRLADEADELGRMLAVRARW